jgi:hypothetical protein
MMFAMILNNTVWIRRKTFSSTWHTAHYFLAATFLVLYIPRHDLWPVMQGPKYGYTNMNIFIFQMVLGTIAGLTHLHQFIALLTTMVYMVINVKLWYGVGLLPICIWDGYLHMIMPVTLMISLGYVGTKERIKKDEKMQAEFSDIKKVLGSLDQGVALTVNFPDLMREAENAKAAETKKGKVNPKIIVQDLENSV